MTVKHNLSNKMDTNPNEPQEAIIPDEELELEPQPVDTEDVETLKAALEKAQKATKQVLARAKKAEGELKTYKKPTQHINNQEEKKVPDVDSLKEEIWTIADYIREGYDRQDVEFIIRNGGREALKDPNSYVSIALKSKLEQRRAEAEASKTSSSAGMSEIERKYTPEQLKNMSSEELKKILPHA